MISGFIVLTNKAATASQAKAEQNNLRQAIAQQVVHGDFGTYSLNEDGMMTTVYSGGAGGSVGGGVGSTSVTIVPYRESGGSFNTTTVRTPLSPYDHGTTYDAYPVDDSANPMRPDKPKSILEQAGLAPLATTLRPGLDPRTDDLVWSKTVLQDMGIVKPDPLTHEQLVEKYAQTGEASDLQAVVDDFTEADVLKEELDAGAPVH